MSFGTQGAVTTQPQPSQQPIQVPAQQLLQVGIDKLRQSIGLPVIGENNSGNNSNASGQDLLSIALKSINKE